MRKDTSFSEKKLGDEQFSDNYWYGGELLYQYHTMNVSDGRDEREQLITTQCEVNQNGNKKNTDSKPYYCRWYMDYTYYFILSLEPFVRLKKYVECRW